MRLSKRTGDIITLREVLDEVGADAVRFFLLSRSADSQMDFDLDLAKEQSDENPVYYIQYAHARICSILRHAGELDYAGGDVSLLTIRARAGADPARCCACPRWCALAAEHLAPHHLTYYAYELAAAFHAFYRDCRVVSSEPGDEAHHPGAAQAGVGLPAGAGARAAADGHERARGDVAAAWRRCLQPLTAAAKCASLTAQSLALTGALYWVLSQLELGE